jgi:Flp pilus assembly protein TadG
MVPKKIDTCFEMEVYSTRKLTHWYLSVLHKRVHGGFNTTREERVTNFYYATDTFGVTVQATVKTQTPVQISISNILILHRAFPNSTCKEILNSHIQVVSSKFIFLKVWSRDNFGKNWDFPQKI